MTPGPLDITVSHPDGRAKSVRSSLEIGEQKRLEVFFDAIAGERAEASDPRVAMTSTRSDAFGRLTLGLNPEGVVETEDGEVIGTTPIVEKKMQVGAHTLVLRSRDGRLRRRVTIEIGAGENAVFRFQLGRDDEVPGASRRR